MDWQRCQQQKQALRYGTERYDSADPRRDYIGIAQWEDISPGAPKNRSGRCKERRPAPSEQVPRHNCPFCSKPISEWDWEYHIITRHGGSLKGRALGRGTIKLIDIAKDLWPLTKPTTK